MKPVRIQMKRVKGFRLQEESKKINGRPCVLVSRPTKWGNPYKVGKLSEDGRYAVSIEQAVAFYRDLILAGRIGVVVEELRGKNLACWCKIGDPCHADVLLEIANQ